jgi:hypothetical protein
MDTKVLEAHYKAAELNKKLALLKLYQDQYGGKWRHQLTIAVTLNYRTVLDYSAT